MSVVGEHAMLVFPAFWAAFAARSWAEFHGPAWVGALAYTPLKIFWSGGAAVSIFFVLSGAVLSFPFLGGKTIGVGQYAVKRMVRLYPVYLVGLLGAYGLYALIGNTPDVQTSAWFQRNWHVDIGLTDWVRALLFMKSDFLQLNSPLWSIIHEARVSVIFPVLIALYLRSRVATLGCSLLVGAGAVVFRLKFPDANSDVANFSDTLSVIWLFMFGVLIAENRARIESIFAKSGSLMALSCAGAAVLLLTAGFVASLPSYVSYFTTRGGAILAVVAAMSGQSALDFLKNRTNDWLGYISYSMYACHFPIIYAVVKLTPGFPLYLSVLCGFAVALVCAVLLCRTVEAWSLRKSQAFRFAKASPAARPEPEAASPAGMGC